MHTLVYSPDHLPFMSGFIRARSTEIDELSAISTSQHLPKHLISSSVVKVPFQHVQLSLTT